MNRLGYHDNEALIGRIEELLRGAGARARLEARGKTVEGREIPLLHVAGVGRTPSETRPQALLCANVHGNEVIASEAALAVLELLLEPEPRGLAAELLELGDITVLPAVNLDSRAAASRALVEGKPWSASLRGNAHGVDLNRNFPFCEGAVDVWHPLAGTSRSWLPWYRGPESLSEPESTLLAEIATERPPLVSLNLHSTGGLFLYPYCCRSEEPAKKEQFLAMGQAFRAAQGAEPYTVKQARSWYTILGDMDDWLYDRFGTLAVTVELSRLNINLGSPAHLLRTLGWMNPPDPTETLVACVPAILAALCEGLRQETRHDPPEIEPASCAPASRSPA